MRECGYLEIENPHTRELSYARSLSFGRFYPRFHIYFEKDFINLHLDAKQPSYEGAAAHGGEYESSVVAEEARRIKNISEKFISEKLVGGQLGFQPPLTLKRLLMRLLNIFKKD